MDEYVYIRYMYTYGGFLKWWYPQNTPNWSYLVGKPMVVGYHHFRKHPYISIGSMNGICSYIWLNFTAHPPGRELFEEAVWIRWKKNMVLFEKDTNIGLFFTVFPDGNCHCFLQTLVLFQKNVVNDVDPEGCWQKLRLPFIQMDKLFTPSWWFNPSQTY